MYAQRKVANDPRLKAVCTRIVEQLEGHYAEPITGPQEEEVAQSGRSTTLQLAALDQARNDPSRRPTRMARGSRSLPPVLVDNANRNRGREMLSRDQLKLLGTLGRRAVADALLDRIRDRGTFEGGRTAPQAGCWINYNRKSVRLEDH